MKNSKEILEFKNHFERRTNVKVVGVKENKEFFHWKRLLLSDLRGSELIRIGEYMINYFLGKASLSEFDGGLYLTVDVKDIKEKIM